MRATKAILLCTLALAIARPAPPSDRSAPALQLADMGMGDLGPQLGGSSNDMVLDDPGHLPQQPDMDVTDPGREPAEADMIVSDPGRVPSEPDMVVDDPGTLPPEPNMNVQPQQDLDRDDDID